VRWQVGKVVRQSDGKVALQGVDLHRALLTMALLLLRQIYVALYTKTTQLNNAVHILAHS